jgi:putative transposase
LVKVGAMKRQPYPTDLSDTQWQHLEPLLPPGSASGRPREIPLREILDAYWYLLRAGCSWRMLPHDFPAWQTVYSQVRRWKHDGTWQQLHARLVEESRLAEGRPPQPSAAVLDSQTVKAGDHAGHRGYDGGKKNHRPQAARPGGPARAAAGRGGDGGGCPGPGRGQGRAA